MPLHNVTVEDSSPLVVYRNASQWIDSLPTSPDYAQYSGPSDTFNSNHNTSEIATVDFAFNGTSIYVFGSTGPTHGNFIVTLIPNNNFPPVQDYSLAPPNSIENTTSTSFSSDTKFKQLLYSKTGLDQSTPHFISITNSGEGEFILDYFIVECNYTSNAPISEYTIDDSNPNFIYTGNWTFSDYNNATLFNSLSSQNTKDFVSLFSNKTIHDTDVDGDKMTMKFNGSGMEIHGVWSVGTFLVTLDDKEPLRVNKTVHPEGVFNRPRELLYFADGLEEKEHTLTIVQGPLNGSFGGLSIDYAVVSTTNLDTIPDGIAATPVPVVSATPTETRSTGQDNSSVPNFGNNGAALGTFVASLLMVFQLLYLIPHRK